MSTQWQYLQDGQSIGPIDEEDLREMLASGELKTSTPIRCTDLGEASWRPAKSVSEFKALFTSLAVLVQVPSDDVSSIAVVEAPKPTFDVNRPILVSFETNGPIKAITAREEGANVVKWMWRFAFAAWAVCFLPIPGLSTFLVWLFAAVSGTLAFVALFKNRVGAGIGCSIALMFVTPAVWFFSLWLYAMLLGTAAIRAEEAAQARRSGAQNQAAVQNEDSRTTELRRQEAQASEPQRHEATESHSNVDSKHPAQLTIRDPCLAYKCGSSVQQVAEKALSGFNEFQKPNSTVFVPSSTRLLYLDTVSVTSRPGKAVVIARKYLQEFNHTFEVGDEVYLYANWGEGCVASWSKGRAFGMSNQNECLNMRQEPEFLKLLEEPQQETWVMAQVHLKSGTKPIYFAGNDFWMSVTDDAQPPPPPSGQESNTSISESAVIGRWSDQDGICEYFSNYSLVCNLNSGAPPIERRWSLNGDLLEWHGGAKRYVYRVVELTPQQMILENVLPESARGTRWVETRVN